VRKDEFDKVAEKFVKRITAGTIVSLSSWVVRTYLFCLGIPILWFILAGLGESPAPLRLWTAVLLVLVFGLLLQARGAVVAWLLGRAFFANERGQPSRLGSLRNQTVGHVLCATVVISAAPFYFPRSAPRGSCFSQMVAFGTTSVCSTSKETKKSTSPSMPEKAGHQNLPNLPMIQAS
jgi:hypothetical protein